LTSPGPQGVADKAAAEKLARRANEYMAEQCRKNPKRFSGFASCSMHDPKQAAEELRYAVKELGLVGLMYEFGIFTADGKGQRLSISRPRW
jgi:2,3-dihydroxybenzoate decarboxylase